MADAITEGLSHDVENLLLLLVGQNIDGTGLKIAVDL
jgi:hypothetical protein